MSIPTIENARICTKWDNNYYSHKTQLYVILSDEYNDVENVQTIIINYEFGFLFIVPYQATIHPHLSTNIIISIILNFDLFMCICEYISINLQIQNLFNFYFMTT